MESDLSNKSNYLKLYEEYKERYKEDRLKAKELNSSFDMPLPEIWDEQSVHLRAFLDRDSSFYAQTLSPFEFSLKKRFSHQEQDRYEELVSIYREEYFSYQERDLSYGFFLKDEDDLELMAQEYALEQDGELLKQFTLSWQKNIQELKSENIQAKDFRELRFKEKSIVQDFEHTLSRLVYSANRYSRDLAKLLSDYEMRLLRTEEYSLELHFSSLYDLGDGLDLVEYLQVQKRSNVTSDIGEIREIIQTKISHNNKEAELAQKDATQESMGDILLEFASNEQEIVTLYRSLVTKYFSFLGVEGDFVLINEPFELYFDNYFADFANSLRYYKYIYAQREDPLTQTPYYLKMFNATQAKVSMLNLNIEESMHEIKKAYISKRHYLTELKLTQREYSQEFDTLLEEFKRYGDLYIKEINDNKYDLEEHHANVAHLQERFDLREEYGFF